MIKILKNIFSKNIIYYNFYQKYRFYKIKKTIQLF